MKCWVEWINKREYLHIQGWSEIHILHRAHIKHKKIQKNVLRNNESEQESDRNNNDKKIPESSGGKLHIPTSKYTKGDEDT